MGEGDYIVLVDGQRLVLSHWDDIPAEVDAIIKFVPRIPPGPHTQAQHDEIEQLPSIFREFLKRERPYASRYKDR